MRFLLPVSTIIAPSDLQRRVREWRLNGKTIGFVPTMGALHEGHISLVAAAREKVDHIVVSIFVNPLQFGPKEDFGSYPRMLQADIEKLQAAGGVDIVFAPIAKDIYPEGFQTNITNTAIAGILCGRSRPGHFDGVLTVVGKLFNLVQPDFAFFGKKDYQQLKLISNMVRDLAFPLTVLGIETRRESDGLAMSSRNLRLTKDEREKAPKIFAALKRLAEAAEAGEKDVAMLVKNFENELGEEKAFRLDYIDVRSQDRLDAFSGELNKPAVALVAAHLGNVRLIDNLEFSAP
ncbi:MAG: pantoate--beta-alanine ligase [Bdellovibrionota bacterium]